MVVNYLATSTFGLEAKSSDLLCLRVEMLMGHDYEEEKLGIDNLKRMD